MPRPRKGSFPCCIDLPLCMHALSPLPRWNRKVHLSLSSSAISAFPEIMAGRLPHHASFEACSARSHLHVTACISHQVTFDDPLHREASSRFVTSTTAPIATGWNESCRAGFAPAGKPCLRTAHKIAYVIFAFLLSESNLSDSTGRGRTHAMLVRRTANFRSTHGGGVQNA